MFKNQRIRQLDETIKGYGEEMRNDPAVLKLQKELEGLRKGRRTKILLILGTVLGLGAAGAGVSLLGGKNGVSEVKDQGSERVKQPEKESESSKESERDSDELLEVKANFNSRKRLETYLRRTEGSASGILQTAFSNISNQDLLENYFDWMKTLNSERKVNSWAEGSEELELYRYLGNEAVLRVEEVAKNYAENILQGEEFFVGDLPYVPEDKELSDKELWMRHHQLAYFEPKKKTVFLPKPVSDKNVYHSYTRHSTLLALSEADSSIVRVGKERYNKEELGLNVLKDFAGEMNIPKIIQSFQEVAKTATKEVSLKEVLDLFEDTARTFVKKGGDRERRRGIYLQAQAILRILKEDELKFFKKALLQIVEHPEQVLLQDPYFTEKNVQEFLRYHAEEYLKKSRPESKVDGSEMYDRWKDKIVVPLNLKMRKAANNGEFDVELVRFFDAGAVMIPDALMKKEFLGPKDFFIGNLGDGSISEYRHRWHLNNNVPYFNREKKILFFSMAPLNEVETLLRQTRTTLTGKPDAHDKIGVELMGRIKPLLAGEAAPEKVAREIEEYSGAAASAGQPEHPASFLAKKGLLGPKYQELLDKLAVSKARRKASYSFAVDLVDLLEGKEKEVLREIIENPHKYFQ